MSLSSHDLQAATQVIQSHERLLIIPHANVDPDGLSSALACYHIFRALGKDCTVICPDSPPESLQFLPGFEHLSTEIDEGQNFVITLDCSGGVEIDKLRYSVEDQKVNIIVMPKKGRFKARDVSILDSGSNYDLIVVVDSADLSLLGSVYQQHVDLFASTPILNIDHHISNTQFGQMKLIDPTAASATEVLFQWFKSQPTWRELLTQDIATLLLTGLITDTRSFQNPNTTPKSLEIAAELLDLGARQQEIIKNVYKTKPLSTLKIWGRALNRIQMDPDARIVWSAVSREDLDEMGATSKETHGILDELISTIPDADLHVLFTEVEEGGLKVSLRSSQAVDASMTSARLFGGGGHSRAAGFKVKQYGNFQLAVIECVQKLKEELRRQRAEADAAPAPGQHVNAMNPSISETILPQEEAKNIETQTPSHPLRKDVLQTIRSDEKNVAQKGTDIVEELKGKQTK